MTREGWLNRLMEELSPVFQEKGFPLPGKIRLTCGIPGGSRSGKILGQCWNPDASSDGTTEIMVSPLIDNANEAAGVLVHELCHAAVGVDKKHGKEFRAAARAMLLVGKPGSCREGAEFLAEFGEIIQACGKYPHAALDFTSRKKAKTYLLKAACPACGYTIRLSAKWADLGLPTCPCGTKMEGA